MKKVIILSALIAMFSCCNSKKAITENKLTTTCPETGTCNLTVSENKKIVVKKDGIDRLYYTTEDQPGTNVYVYQYNKKTEGEYADGGYREEIIFELKQDSKQINLEGKNLHEAKLLFGVMCFCRSKAGTYEVSTGKLNVNNGKVSIELPDVVPDQILKNISFSIK